MFPHFKSLILSHQKAPLAVRELFALDEAAARNLLRYLGNLPRVDASGMDTAGQSDVSVEMSGPPSVGVDTPGMTDILVLSTCNRMEVYYCSPADQTAAILQGLFEQKQIQQRLDYRDYFTVLNNPDAAMQHLFRVAVGLESREMGDAQIYHQVKRAYEYSVEENLAGPFLHRLMHTIFFTHKRMVQETSFRDGATSVSRAAVELAEMMVEKLAQPTILVIGLGEIGSDVCHYLSEIPRANVWLSNRTDAKAEKLAARYGFQPVPFEQVFQAMEAADVIISSVYKEQPLITKDVIVAPRLRYQYFIDLAVPRSVEASLEELPGVVLYNIDDLHQKTTQVLEKRLAAIPQVERILWETMEQFKDWTNELVMSPLVSQLKNALETIRQEEMVRFTKKMSPEEAQLAEALTKSITQKFLKMPVLQLKAACKRGEADMLLHVLSEVFNLENPTRRLITPQPEVADRCEVLSA